MFWRGYDTGPAWLRSTLARQESDPNGSFRRPAVAPLTGHFDLTRICFFIERNLLLRAARIEGCAEEGELALGCAKRGATSTGGSGGNGCVQFENAFVQNSHRHRRGIAGILKVP